MWHQSHPPEVCLKKTGVFQDHFNTTHRCIVFVSAPSATPTLVARMRLPGHAFVLHEWVVLLKMRKSQLGYRGKGCGRDRFFGVVLKTRRLCELSVGMTQMVRWGGDDKSVLRNAAKKSILHLYTIGKCGHAKPAACEYR